MPQLRAISFLLTAVTIAIVAENNCSAQCGTTGELTASEIAFNKIQAPTVDTMWWKLAASCADNRDCVEIVTKVETACCHSVLVSKSYEQEARRRIEIDHDVMVKKHAPEVCEDDCWRLPTRLIACQDSVCQIISSQPTPETKGRCGQTSLDGVAIPQNCYGAPPKESTVAATPNRE